MERPSFVLAALSPAAQQPYSPVQVQKLFFLLDRNLPEEFGTPFFNFEPYNYGPFDHQVYNDLEELDKQELIEIDRRGQWRLYRLTPKGLEIGRDSLGNLPVNIANYIGEISEFVRRLSFSELVSAIYKAYPEMKQNSVFSE